MRLRNLILSIYTSTAIIFAGGSQPTCSMQLLHRSYPESTDKNIIKAVEKIIEPEAELLDSSLVKLKNGIKLADIDGDGKNEVIAFYRNKNTEARAGILILKQTRNQTWQKIYQYTSPGSDLNYIKISDFNKDGKADILIGWHIGAIYNELNIFLWHGGKVVMIDGGPFSKLYVKDIKDKRGHKDGKEEIALWLHDTGEAYKINIYRLEGTTLVLAKDVYPDYFKNIVVPFYKQKVREMPGAAFYLYYLADAQIKAGDPRGALISIYSGLKILESHAGYYPDKLKFEELKKKAEDMLNKPISPALFLYQ